MAEFISLIDVDLTTCIASVLLMAMFTAGFLGSCILTLGSAITNT